MIDYKSCNELIDLLDKGDIKKLRKYIDVERNRYYIGEARRALTQYLKRGASPYCVENINKTAYYDYEAFTICNLLLTDGYSAYFLNSAEILTMDRRNKVAGTLHASSNKIIDLYKKLEINQAVVEKIIKCPAGERDDKALIDLKTKEGKMYTFYEDEFSFAEKFLGEDVQYSVSEYYNNGGVCLVKSMKGAGFILGRKEI